MVLSVLVAQGVLDLNPLRKAKGADGRDTDAKLGSRQHQSEVWAKENYEPR